MFYAKQVIGKSFRFHGLGSLSYVYRRGQTAREGQLALKYIVNNHRENFRAAVVVGRKVNKSAVVRNRIRRRIYETIRLSSKKINEPYDLVFTVFNDNVAEMDNKKLEQLVNKLLTKASVINKG